MQKSVKICVENGGIYSYPPKRDHDQDEDSDGRGIAGRDKSFKGSGIKTRKTSEAQKTLIDRGEISAGCGITIWGKLKRNAGLLNMPKVEFLIKTVQYLSC